MMKVCLRKPTHRQSALAGRYAARTGARRLLRASFLILVCWLFVDVSPQALRLKGESVEYPAKLAFLYNFAKFVEWPTGSYTSPGAPLSICIVGHDPFDRDIESELQTRQAWGHPVVLLTLRPAEALNNCHMVFIPVTEKDQAGKILQSLEGSTILTVGETAGFAAMGGVINLTVEKSEVRFEVNPLAAGRAHLKISSKLLSLAKLVTDQGQAK